MGTDLNIGDVVNNEWTVLCRKGWSGVNKLYKFAHTCGEEVVASEKSIKSGRKCRRCSGTKSRRKPVDTLCWSCRRAVGGCSWSRSFTPVDGWDAIPTTIQYSNQVSSRNKTESYIVISCPQYAKDKERG